MFLLSNESSRNSVPVSRFGDPTMSSQVAESKRKQLISSALILLDITDKTRIIFVICYLLFVI